MTSYTHLELSAMARDARKDIKRANSNATPHMGYTVRIDGSNTCLSVEWHDSSTSPWTRGVHNTAI